MPESGPFASPEVPEDLAELRARELEAIGTVRVPRDLSRPAAGLAALLRREEEIRRKEAADRWAWRKPQFDGPLARRQLRILSALFNALVKRGHEGEAYERDGELHASCTIGDVRLGLGFHVIGRHRTEMRGGFQRPAADLPASTPLRLALPHMSPGDVSPGWEDGGNARLERRLAEIGAELIVLGEATFRRGLVDARERAEEQQRWLEARERERIEAANRERLNLLETSGALLRQAEDLRALVERVSAAVERGSLVLGEGELGGWRRWALDRADELDPVVSGQVLQHIRPPRVD